MPLCCHTPSNVFEGPALTALHHMGDIITPRPLSSLLSVCECTSSHVGDTRYHTPQFTPTHLHTHTCDILRTPKALITRTWYLIQPAVFPRRLFVVRQVFWLKVPPPSSFPSILRLFLPLPSSWLYNKMYPLHVTTIILLSPALLLSEPIGCGVCGCAVRRTSGAPSGNCDQW